MRKIPATMATQHPDNAAAPYWDKQKDPFVSAYREIEESVECFKNLNVSEYMWDWEGKHADASVIDKLFSEYYDYFAENQLNRDKFLTFRIPNIWEEKGYSLLLAMTVILTSEDLAEDLKFDNRPLFEIILPMTENADQLMKMHESFEKLADFKSKEFALGHKSDSLIELIPLTESVQSQQQVGKLLREYVEKYQKRYAKKPEYIRPFFARSDPALVSGLIPTVLANKIALSQSYSFSEESGIPVFPISGLGSLPFRGGLTPDTIDRYLQEYPGMRTVTLQSSFRYDHPIESVKKAINKLETSLPKTKPKIYTKEAEQQLIKIGKVAEGFYQKTLQEIVVDLRIVFAAVPKRRERRQHIGLLAYGRKVGAQKMPRAITFTAGFYSLGVPPEFIGVGRALEALGASDLKTLLNEYPSINQALQRAGKYLNRANLNKLASNNPGWQEVKQDIELAESILGIKFGPETDDEKSHQKLTTGILELAQTNSPGLSQKITEAAVLRKSLG